MHDRNAQIHQLIEQHHYLDALESIVTNASDVVLAAHAYRDYVIGQHHLLLRAARESVRDDAKRKKLTKLLASAMWKDFCVALKNRRLADSSDGTALPGHPLEAQSNFIAASLGNHTELELQTEIGEVIESYESAWGFQWWCSDREFADFGRQSAAIAAICESRFVDALAPWMKVPQRGGVFHPAIAMLAELWNFVHGDEEVCLRSDFRAETTLLFAVRYAPGVLAKIMIERVPHGCGVLYPHPLHASLWRTDADWQEGLQNAWWAEIGHRLVTSRRSPARDDSIGCDFRWQLELLSTDDDRFIDPQLEGRSAEVAIACALRAARLGHRLDDNVAASAVFAKPRSRVFQVTRITGLVSKTWADEIAPSARDKRITRIVVADDQPEKGQQLDNGHLQLVGQPNFDGVYHQLDYFETLTRKANIEIGRQACEYLEKNCNAATPDHYVRSPLQREKPQDDRKAPANDDEEDSLETLADDEVERIIKGRHPARRARFFADSGVGKTTFLVYCEKQIAESQTGVLPIRLTNLKGYSWDDPKKIETALVHTIAAFLPDADKKLSSEWYEYLRQTGKMIFLLDALDQTSADRVLTLHQWLSRTGHVDQCTIYVTGRKATMTSRLFDGIQWETLYVGLLEPQQVDEFLGKELADFFRPYFGDNAEVLRVPMVLSLLKGLEGSGELGSPMNRERIYYAALEGTLQRDKTTLVEGLISKGLRTASDSDFPNPDLETIERIASLLAFAAWTHLRQFGFSGYVQGTEYDELVRQVKKVAREQFDTSDPKLMKLLFQINLFHPGLFESSKDFLQWRHLSFCEYFAGVYLANVLAASNDDRLACGLDEILDMIAAVSRAKEADATDDTRSPRDAWRWVFRFALSRLHADVVKAKPGKTKVEAEQRRDTLVAALLAHGVPFVVYEAMTDDGVTVADEYRDLCCWLVHQAWDDRDYGDAWPKDNAKPVLSTRSAGIITSLFDRRFRDSRILAAAYELAEQSPDLRASIDAILRSDRDSFSTAELATLDRLANSFRDCPPRDLDLSKCDNLWPASKGLTGFVFRMGAPASDDEAYSDERPQHLVLVRPFQMMEFGVANDEFELLDPSHYYFRDDYSRADDQPVHRVNWHVADFYSSLWLPHMLVADELKAFEYALPTECQREFAARGGVASRFPWGDEFDAARCNSHKASVDRTLGRAESLAHGDRYRNRFQLCHMAGNLHEWCVDWFDSLIYEQRESVLDEFGDVVHFHGEQLHASSGGPRSGFSRVLRGGSFSSGTRNCRSSYRDHFGPRHLFNRMGFRVCRELRVPQSS